LKPRPIYLEYRSRPEVLMGQVIADITMTVDGFIAGPNDGVEKPLGEGGERIHQWLYDSASWRELHGRTGGEARTDGELVEEAFERTGAVVMGKRMFQIGDGPNGWGDDPPFHKPVFVLTHEAREPSVKGDTTFTFVTDGIESALEQARAAAGDKDVSVGGGANAIQQFIKAGLLDELQVHVAHVLLGDGISLFGQGPEQIELESTRVMDSSGVTHLRFRVAK
jgi:dihydrofolate reductase